MFSRRQREALSDSVALGRISAKAVKLRRLIALIGPRPVKLAQTLVFLASRQRRRVRLRHLYAMPLPRADVELRLPPVILPTVSGLPAELRPFAHAIRDEAEHVLAHRVDFLGSGLVDLGDEIDWHRDFKSGYRWPKRFFEELDVTRLDDGSDAKVPWELSRCHHLLVLARAARLFEEERYAAELESQLASWIEANPPGIGINWVTPMEVGIRAVNLVWTIAQFEQWRRLAEGLRARLIVSLRWHARHIAANLEGTPYLRSNHYLGDILGLLVLGVVLKGDPEAPRWLEFGHREFEREIENQVLADGVSFEASLAYHGLVLEMLLVAWFVGEWSERPFSPKFQNRLRRMMDVSRAVRHPNGRVPLFGDQDSGRILPEGFARPATHDNVLWLGAALLGEDKPIEGPVHREVAWTLGVDRWRGATGLPPGPPPGSAGFRSGGVYVLNGNETHAVVRCGNVGQNGSGGHSHNDILSYELSIDGVPLVIDSGTYAYTFDVRARNAFRSTRAHNTVIVDGAEIHPLDQARVFELRAFARPNVEVFNPNADVLELVGSHDGYRRLADPVLHRRRFKLDIAQNRMSILDHFAGKEEHVFQSLVHLAAGTSVHRKGDARFEVERAHLRVTISFSGVTREELEVIDGWVSDRYGVRERAPVLSATVRRICPVSLSYSIAPTRTRCAGREGPRALSTPPPEVDS
jgi:hypothetical protein